MSRKIIAAITSALLIFGVSACSESSTTSSDTPTSTSSSSKQSDEAKKKTEEKEKQQKAKEEKELSAAKTALSSKITEAHSLLDSSNNNVADAQTRVDLTNAINTATAFSGTDSTEYYQAVDPLQKAMDSVTASINQKSQNDAAAAAAAAQAAQQAQQAQATQQAQAQAQAQQRAQAQTQPQNQGGTGSLYATCRDGSQSVSRPGAPNYQGMCSHHGGIAQKLGPR